MSVPNALILWPIRFTATTYVLRITSSGGGTEDLTFPATGSLTVDRDYFMAGDSQADAAASPNNGEGDLLALLQATLLSSSGVQTYTVTLDANFHILITASSGTFSIEWAHANTTLDQSIFGFTDASTASAISCTSDYIPKGIYRPGRPISDDAREHQPIVGGVGRSVSGRTRVSRFALPSKDRQIQFQYLTQDVALNEYADSSGPTNTFEYAWVNSMSLGRYWRLYEDESSRTSSSYRLYQISSLEDELVRNQNFKIFWDRPIESTLIEVP